MATCKICGTKSSIWSARSDGLCKDCGTKADEDAKREAEKKEAERKQQVLEDSRKNVDLIVRAMTPEPPLSYTFINWNIQQKKSGGLLGVVVGGALGGMAGAMIGNCLAPGSCSYSGEIGILVVTQSQILIGHFTAPLQTGDGRIIPDHLGLFRSQLDSKTIARKTFNIRQTQVSRSTQSDSTINLVCGAESLTFCRSELYVNDALFETPSVADIQNQIAQQGTLVTPADFTAKLLRGENPISEGQFHEVEKDEKYITAIFMAILTHSDRDTLVQKFPCLVPPVRAALEARIKSKGSSSRSARVKLLVWVVLAITAFVGIFVTEDFLCFLSVVGTLVTAIGSIVSAVSLSRTTWCHDKLKSEAINGNSPKMTCDDDAAASTRLMSTE